MVVVSVVVHPQGLHPFEAVRAWQKHREEGMSLNEVRSEVVKLQGQKPSKKAFENAVKRVDMMRPGDVVPKSGYDKCGRKPAFTQQQQDAVVAFVKKWRNKRFCTCAYIKTTMKLQVTKRTIANVLNRHGFFWRPVPKKHGLSSEDLAKRKAFVDKYNNHSATRWERNLNLVLDGVTLTMAPKPLNARQAHAAQSI